jgi:hypothetical protein
MEDDAGLGQRAGMSPDELKRYWSPGADGRESVFVASGTTPGTYCQRVMDSNQAGVTRLAACVFLACAVVAAIVIHRHTHAEPCGLGFDRPVCAERDAWQDPLALGIGVVGLLVAGALIYIDRRGILRP